jgi:hypothetical protein
MISGESVKGGRPSTFVRALSASTTAVPATMNIRHTTGNPPIQVVINWFTELQQRDARLT